MTSSGDPGNVPGVSPTETRFAARDGERHDVYARITRATWERLDELARANERTISAEVRIAIRERLERLDREAAEK